MTCPVIQNSALRRLFLDRHRLLAPPHGAGTGADLLQLITELGFVQLDSINTVERAHHMILFARRQSYRPAHLTRLFEQDRLLFEHWTHDAAIIPMAFYANWSLKFARDAAVIKGRWKNWGRDGFEEKFDAVLEHLRTHGACGTAEIGRDEKRSSGGWWQWNPSKTALEYLWRAGDLAISRRDGFKKIYDLTENVVPDGFRHAHASQNDLISWFCEEALNRLGVGSPTEIAAFWDVVSIAEARQWAETAKAAGRVIDVEVCATDGTTRPALIRPETLAEIADLPDPSNRVRILSPFDPMLRDRQRAERIFGFDYRIEVFVPAAKRKYGYYVFPILEADRMIGRIDMKRSKGVLNVTGLWPEHGIRFGKGRMARFLAELDRMARFSGCHDVTFAPDWLKT